MSRRVRAFKNERLKRYRREAGFTQLQVAIRCEMSLSAYVRLEQKTDVAPNLTTLIKIANVLGKRLDDFV